MVRSVLRSLTRGLQSSAFLTKAADHFIGVGRSVFARKNVSTRTTSANSKAYGFEYMEPRFCLSGTAFVPVPFEGIDESYFGNLNGDESNVIALGDLDNDGDLEAVVDAWLDIDEQRIVWFENTDDQGNLTERTTIYSMTPEECEADNCALDDVVESPTIILEDLDGDSDLDVVAVRYNSVSWFENVDGLGSFGPAKIIRENDHLTWGFPLMTVGDFDHDRDLDIITSANGGMRWHENTDSQGTFEAHTVLADFSAVSRGFETGDIDGDGYEDVAYLRSSFAGSLGVQWLEFSEATKEFSSHIIDLGPPVGGSSIVLSDMDGDNDLDVIVAAGNHGLAWYPNVDGDGNFGKRIEIDAQDLGLLRGLESLDFDRDNDQDLLIKYWGRDHVGLYENVNGLGTFGPLQDVSIDVGTVLDLDHDGDQDIWTNSVWYENRVVGDSNDDGRFDSSDLVKIFQAGKYEDGVPMNANYDEGDWNQDGDFDSGDLVFAFQAGTYESIAAQAKTDSIFAAAIDIHFAQQHARKNNLLQTDIC